MEDFKSHFNTKDVPEGFSYNSKENDKWIGVNDIKSLLNNVRGAAPPMNQEQERAALEEMMKITIFTSRELHEHINQPGDIVLKLENGDSHEQEIKMLWKWLVLIVLRRAFPVVQQQIDSLIEMGFPPTCARTH